MPLVAYARNGEAMRALQPISFCSFALIAAIGSIATIGSIVAVGSIAAIGSIAATGSACAAEKQTLEIVSKNGVHVFSVEVANDDASREKGLMFRNHLPEGTGMLFDFQREQNVGFWMKNTYIPLDMIFIRADGRILRIAENAEPLSTQIIRSNGPVLAVLEVIAGTTRKLGIAAGDRVAHPLFRAR